MTITPATFAETLAALAARTEEEVAAAPVQVLDLAPGDYGDVRFGEVERVTVRGSAKAVFRTLELVDCKDIVLEGFSVVWAPTGANPNTGKKADSTKTTVIRIFACERITVRRVTERGELVGKGTPGFLLAASLPTPRANAPLVGYYAGRAVSIESSEDVTVTRCDISGFFSGISVSESPRTTLSLNRIHHLRTTPIKGSGVDFTIHANHLYHMTPYRYRDAAGKWTGDHVDFAHPFTGKGDPPLTGLRITWNLMDAEGADGSIGILEGDNGFVGIPDAVIHDNTILTPNHQGISLPKSGPGEPPCSASVLRNTLLSPTGVGNAPFVIKRGTKVVMEDNVMADSSTKPYLSATDPNNTYLKLAQQTPEMVEAARAKALAYITAALAEEGDPEPPAPDDPRIADLTARIAALNAMVTKLSDLVGRMEGDEAVLRLERDEALRWAADVKAVVNR